MGTRTSLEREVFSIRSGLHHPQFALSIDGLLTAHGSLQGPDGVERQHSTDSAASLPAALKAPALATPRRLGFSPAAPPTPRTPDAPGPARTPQGIVPSSLAASGLKSPSATSHGCGSSSGGCTPRPVSPETPSTTPGPASEAGTADSSCGGAAGAGCSGGGAYGTSGPGPAAAGAGGVPLQRGTSGGSEWGSGGGGSRRGSAGGASVRASAGGGGSSASPSRSADGAGGGASAPGSAGGAGRGGGSPRVSAGGGPGGASRLRASASSAAKGFSPRGPAGDAGSPVSSRVSAEGAAGGACRAASAGGDEGAVLPRAGSEGGSGGGAATATTMGLLGLPPKQLPGRQPGGDTAATDAAASSASSQPTPRPSPAPLGSQLQHQQHPQVEPPRFRDGMAAPEGAGPRGLELGRGGSDGVGELERLLWSGTRPSADGADGAAAMSPRPGWTHLAASDALLARPPPPRADHSAEGEEQRPVGSEAGDGPGASYLRRDGSAEPPPPPPLPLPRTFSDIRRMDTGAWYERSETQEARQEGLEGMGPSLVMRYRLAAARASAPARSAAPYPAVLRMQGRKAARNPGRGCGWGAAEQEAEGEESEDAARGGEWSDAASDSSRGSAAAAARAGARYPAHPVSWARLRFASVGHFPPGMRPHPHPLQLQQQQQQPRRGSGPTAMQAPPPALRPPLPPPPPQGRAGRRRSAVEARAKPPRGGRRSSAVEPWEPAAWQREAAGPRPGAAGALPRQTSRLRNASRQRSREVDEFLIRDRDTGVEGDDDVDNEADAAGVGGQAAPVQPGAGTCPSWANLELPLLEEVISMRAFLEARKSSDAWRGADRLPGGARAGGGGGGGRTAAGAALPERLSRGSGAFGGFDGARSSAASEAVRRHPAPAPAPTPHRGAFRRSASRLQQASGVHGTSGAQRGGHAGQSEQYEHVRGGRAGGRQECEEGVEEGEEGEPGPLAGDEPRQGEAAAGAGAGPPQKTFLVRRSPRAMARLGSLHPIAPANSLAAPAAAPSASHAPGARHLDHGGREGGPEGLGDLEEEGEEDAQPVPAGGRSPHTDGPLPSAARSPRTPAGAAAAQTPPPPHHPYSHPQQQRSYLVRRGASASRAFSRSGSLRPLPPNNSFSCAGPAASPSRNPDPSSLACPGNSPEARASPGVSPRHGPGHDGGPASSTSFYQFECGALYPEDDCERGGHPREGPGRDGSQPHDDGLCWNQQLPGLGELLLEAERERGGEWSDSGVSTCSRMTGASVAPGYRPLLSQRAVRELASRGAGPRRPVSRSVSRPASRPHGWEGAGGEGGEGSQWEGFSRCSSMTADAARVHPDGGGGGSGGGAMWTPFSSRRASPREGSTPGAREAHTQTGTRGSPNPWDCDPWVGAEQGLHTVEEDREAAEMSRSRSAHTQTGVAEGEAELMLGREAGAEAEEWHDRHDVPVVTLPEAEARVVAAAPVAAESARGHPAAGALGSPAAAAPAAAAGPTSASPASGAGAELERLAAEIRREYDKVSQAARNLLWMTGDNDAARLAALRRVGERLEAARAAQVRAAMALRRHRHAGGGGGGGGSAVGVGRGGGAAELAAGLPSARYPGKEVEAMVGAAWNRGTHLVKCGRLPDALAHMAVALQLAPHAPALRGAQRGWMRGEAARVAAAVAAAEASKAAAAPPAAAAAAAPQTCKAAGAAAASAPVSEAAAAAPAAAPAAGPAAATGIGGAAAWRARASVEITAASPERTPLYA